MITVFDIIKHIRKSTTRKKRQYFRYLSSFGEAESYSSSTYRHYDLKKHNYTPFQKTKFGPYKYKLEISINEYYVICIDIKIFKSSSVPFEALYEGNTIDDDTYFNLSMSNDFLLNSKEIELIRYEMNKNAKNRYVSIYCTPVICAELVPSRW